MPMQEYRCPECGRLMFKASGSAEVQVKCKCDRLVTLTIGGKTNQRPEPDEAGALHERGSDARAEPSYPITR